MKSSTPPGVPTDLSPEADGVDHINVYSRGKTVLGRTLSNFAHTPFHHPRDGYFGSLEAYWYWLAIGSLRESPEYRALRSMHGFQCKDLGRKALQKWSELNNRQPPEVPDFVSHIKKAILCKVRQTEGLSEMLKNSTLPLIHYYYWGDKAPYKVSRPEKYDWITDYISDVRDYLNGRADILVIAGSRQIRDLDLVRREFDLITSQKKVVEIVSGLAKGVDALGIQVAKEKKFPWAEFPADWEANGPSAGFIRNAEMANYCTRGLIVWNGESKGTLNMMKNLEKRNIPFRLIDFSNNELHATANISKENV